MRNKIIHELDINLDGDRRKRNHRGLTAMKAHTNKLLELAEEILREVDEKLAKVYPALGADSPPAPPRCQPRLKRTTLGGGNGGTASLRSAGELSWGMA